MGRQPAQLLYLLCLYLGVACMEAEKPPEDFVPASTAPTVLITGSNRGIGFEFARQYARQGWTVLATTRRPEAAVDLKALAGDHPNVIIERLDVLDQPGIEALAEKYRGQAIDLLINNAGVLGEPALQTLDSLDYDTFSEVMAVNVFGALRVSQAFLQHVAASEQKKIVSITSWMGSSEVNGGGGFYFYRVSKAGLNRAMRTLHNEVRDRGVIVAVLAPPGVDTRMYAQGGFSTRPSSPDEAVAALIRVIEELGPGDGGSFLSYQGQTIAW